METLKVALFTFSMFGINTYLVWNPATSECAVIDPGMSNQREEKVLTKFIAEKGLRVTHLLNTHMHIDHVIGDNYVAGTYNIPVEASPADAFFGKNVEAQARLFGITDAVENVEVKKPLKDGDIIHIGTGELHVISLPGHSPGGLAFYDKQDGFVIAGDSLFFGSIGRTDLAGGDHESLISSLKEKLLTLPPHTIVYPGHGPETNIEREMRTNPYLV